MSSSRKKVIIRRFVGDTLPGYLAAGGFLKDLSVELLDLGGRVISLPLNDIKMISYVRDFNLADTANPERLTRRTFLARPRSEGLWIRLTFRSGELLEGLAPTDATFLDGILEDGGVFLTPPDTRSNTQRIFVPRSAVTDVQLLAVISAAARRQVVAADRKESLQDELFHLPLDPDSRPN